VTVVSLTTAALAFMLGIMGYILVPMLASLLPIELRYPVGNFYGSKGARALKQFAIVRRILSGYDVLPIDVDDESKMLRVTLDSSTFGSDTEFRFADPDGRIKRVWNKPMAVCYEAIPAALDAELAEIGYWTREKRVNEGLLRETDGGEVVDPYVRMPDTLRLVDPLDCFELIVNGVDPENIKTTEQLTKKRFEKYGSGIGLKESIRVLLGFFAGAGAVVLIQYINTQLITDGGPSAPDVSVGLPALLPMELIDLVVMIA